MELDWHFCLVSKTTYKLNLAEFSDANYSLENKIIISFPICSEETDKIDNSPVLTQPWSVEIPRTNDYAGFDLTTGSFYRTKSSRQRQVALGAPRAGDLREGTVFIVETKAVTLNSQEAKVKQVAKVHGDKSGEYFGASLLSMDINGDGVDDLIIGSPLYTFVEPSVASVGFEEGRISIFSLNSRSDQLERKLALNGPGGPGARFGAAIANLGDIDQDNYQDFVVGSPFEDNGMGVVRIFYGNPNIEYIQGI